VFRRWSAPKALHGRQIVMHAGSRAIRPNEIAELLNAPADQLRQTLGMVSDKQLADAVTLLERIWKRQQGGGTSLTGMALGTVTLGVPKRCTEIYAGRVAADDIDPEMWGWPVTDIRPFAMPEPAKGAQGFWEWRTALPAFRAREDAA
jgi:hypothetical protein